MLRLLPLLLLSLLPVAPADAQSPQAGGVSVVPASGSTHADGPRLLFRELRPGATSTDRAVVVNGSDEEVRVAVYAADGEPARGGGFGYTERGAATVAVGSWLRLSVEEVVLPPGGRVPVRIDLAVARDAFDGRNVGAVVVEALEQESTGQLPSRTRYAMPVTVDVVGGRPRPAAGADEPEATEPSPPLQLRDLRPGPRGSRLCPTVVLGNARAGGGQTRVRVEADGLLSGSSSVTQSVEVPPSATTTRVQLGCVDRPLGPGRVAVVLEDDEDEAVERDVFWAPWPFIVSLLFLLLLLGALISTFLRGLLRRRDREEAERPAV